MLKAFLIHIISVFCNFIFFIYIYIYVKYPQPLISKIGGLIPIPIPIYHGILVYMLHIKTISQTKREDWNIYNFKQRKNNNIPGKLCLELNIFLLSNILKEEAKYSPKATGGISSRPLHSSQLMNLPSLSLMNLAVLKQRKTHVVESAMLKELNYPATARKFISNVVSMIRLFTTNFWK